MTPPNAVIHSDPDILGGGHALIESPEDFPSVTRDQAVAALRTAAQALMADVSELS